MKKIFITILAAAIAMVNTINCFAATENTDTALKNTAEYIIKTNENPSVGSIGGDWAVFALKSAGYGDEAYFEKYYKNAENYIKENKGVLSTRKYTEYSRTVIAMTAIGKNPADIGGCNLLTPLGDYEKTVWQGINGPVWALIALDCGGYEMPVNKDAKIHATRDMYIKYILDSQCRDGGWSLSGNKITSDIDITAMTLQALAPYTDRLNVRIAVNKGVSLLAKRQAASGGYFAWGSENCESVAQVITALTMLGIDINDTRFVKNGKGLYDALMGFYIKDGGFKHSAADTAPNPMATEQGLYALAAIKNRQAGGKGIYRIKSVQPLEKAA